MISNSEELKLSAEEHLSHLLNGQDKEIFQGKSHDLVILSMCSFACKTVSKTIEELINS